MRWFKITGHPVCIRRRGVKDASSPGFFPKGDSLRWNFVTWFRYLGAFGFFRHRIASSLGQHRRDNRLLKTENHGNLTILLYANLLRSIEIGQQDRYISPYRPSRKIDHGLTFYRLRRKSGTILKLRLNSDIIYFFIFLRIIIAILININKHTNMRQRADQRLEWAN